MNKQLTVHEAAREFNIPRPRIHHAIERGYIKAELRKHPYRKGDSIPMIYMVWRADIENMVEENYNPMVSILAAKQPRRPSRTSKEELALAKARKALEMRAEARSLGLELDEFRQAVS